ncbi:unnamed protein product [Nezara viridula]|uniref:Uncharacterized protein n=1 Tax=Nezara viridula TaxID=85310 RepID=A0A9P0MY50_NEZVI|nr:unnamed protein product [Nezara viridula]
MVGRNVSESIEGLGFYLMGFSVGKYLEKGCVCHRHRTLGSAQLYSQCGSLKVLTEMNGGGGGCLVIDNNKLIKRIITSTEPSNDLVQTRMQSISIDPLLMPLLSAMVAQAGRSTRGFY